MKIKRVLLLVGILSLFFSCPALPQTRTINFIVRWSQQGAVDSTIVRIFTSDSLAPIYQAKGTSPDTIRLTVPLDTLTYRFSVQAYKQIYTSGSSTTNFYFNAGIYYRLTAIVLKPDSVVLNPGQSIRFCPFVKYSDNTVAMRNRDSGFAECGIFYGQFPDSIKVSSGYKQRHANAVCIQWTATGGTIEQEVCP